MITNNFKLRLTEKNTSVKNNRKNMKKIIKQKYRVHSLNIC